MSLTPAQRDEILEVISQGRPAAAARKAGKARHIVLLAVVALVTQAIVAAFALGTIAAVLNGLRTP